MGCHAERSEASAFISLKTNNCRFFAALRMTGIVDFFTASPPRPYLRVAYPAGYQRIGGPLLPDMRRNSALTYVAAGILMDRMNPKTEEKSLATIQGGGSPIS
jgi:hypothetical protein